MADRRPPAGGKDDGQKLELPSGGVLGQLAAFAKRAGDTRKELSKNPLLLAALFGEDGNTSLAVATGALGTFGTAAAVVAKKVYSAFADTFTEFAASIGRLSSTSQAIGNVPIQQLQGLEFAAGRAGVGADALRGTLVDLQNKMYQTTIGNQDAILGFQRLGVSIYKTGGGFKASTDFLDEAVVKLIGIKDPAERTGKALASVGQVGLDLANYFADKGAAAFFEYRKSVQEFGAQLADKDIDAVKEYRFQIGNLGLILEGLKNSVGGPLAQIFAPLTKQFAEWAKGNAKGTNTALRESVGQFSKLGDVALKLGQYVYKLIPFFGFLLEVLIAVGNVVGTVLVFALDTLAFALEKLGPVGIAAAIGILAAFFPLTALFVGLFLLIEDLITFAQGGDSLFGDAIEAFRRWNKELLTDNPDDPWWLRALKTVYQLIVRDIPKAWDDLVAKLTPSFDKIGGFFDDLASKVEKKIGKGVLTTLVRNPLAPFDINESLTVDALRGFGLFGGFAPTSPVGQYAPQFTPAPSAAEAAARQSLPPVVIQQSFSGSIGSLKEVRDLAKSASEAAISEYSDTVVASLNR